MGRHFTNIKLSLGVALILSGCVHAIDLGNSQKCASEGMSLEGINLGEAQSNMYGSTEMRAVQCTQPKSIVDKCKIYVYGRSLIPLDEFNNRVFAKQSFIAIGYCIWIFPGIMAFLIFQRQREDAINNSMEIISSEMKHCIRPSNEREAQSDGIPLIPSLFHGTTTR